MVGDIFHIGDRAITRTDVNVYEKYAGLTCTVVGTTGNGEWLRIVFDDDPCGIEGTKYSTNAESLVHIIPDFQIDAVASFIDEM